MDRDEIKRRTWVCSCGDQDAILAEFDRLTEELQKALMAEGYLKQAVDTYKPKAEALERICEPIGQEFKEDGPDILRSLCKDIALIRLARYPENIPQTLERICDYLDSQQKPQAPLYRRGERRITPLLEKPIEFDCAECGETLTVQHDYKPKDEEVLREILSSCFGCSEKENTTLAILEHFQLKEGE